MDLGKSLTISKYLIKNYIVNPFLKGLRRKAILIIALAVMVGIIAAAIVISSTSAPENESNESLGPSIRGSLLALGLNKFAIIDLISASLMLMILLGAITGKAAITVMEEAEYEILLAQPLDMETYFLGRFLRDTAQMLAFTAWYIAFVPIAMDLSGGNPKAALLPISILLLTAYLSALATLIHELKITWRGDYIRLIASSYALISIIHSILSWGISPLLSVPFRPLAESIVYCATISEGTSDVLLSIGEGLLILLLMLLLDLGLAGRISPEYIKPASALMKVKKKKPKRNAEFYSRDPRKAIFNYIFRLEVLNIKHIATISLITLITWFTTYFLKEVASGKLGILFGSFQFISIFLIPLLVSEALAFLINASMARDLAALWIYRVYAKDLKPMAESLMMKYALYLSEAFLVISVFDAVASSNFLMLFLPLLMLPLTVLIACILLMIVTYLASKRRIVKQAPSGLYMLEELAAGLLMLVVIPVYMISDLLLKIALSLLSSSEAVFLSLVAVISSWLLLKLLTSPLADIISSYDIAS